MDDFLKFININPWAITAPVTVLIGVVGWIINTRLKARKSMSWTYESMQALRYLKNVKSDLSITFKGEDITSLWLSNVRIANVGNMEIIDSDFFDPITISAKGSKILEADIDSKDGFDAPVTIEVVDDCKVILNIPLINPREKFSIRLLTDKKPDLSLSGRVKGISKIYQDKESLRYAIVAITSGIIVGSLCALFFPTSLLLEGSRIFTFFIISLLLSVYGYVLSDPMVRKRMIRNIMGIYFSR